MPLTGLPVKMNTKSNNKPKINYEQKSIYIFKKT